MIARTVLILFLALFIFIIFRALVTGKIEYGSGKDLIVGDRFKSPRKYWTLLVVVTFMSLGFLWLLLG